LARHRDLELWRLTEKRSRKKEPGGQNAEDLQAMHL
jgi:hypothetical protein